MAATRVNTVASRRIVAAPLANLVRVRSDVVICKLTLRRILARILFISIASVSGGAMAADDLAGFIRAILTNPVDEIFLENSFHVKLEKTVDNPGELRYQGVGPVLVDGLRIDKLLLVKYSNGSPAPLIVGADISGRCVNRQEIENSFKNVKLVGAPTHAYSNAVWTYNSQTENGLIEFFVNAHSHCLSSLKIFLGGPVR